MSKAYTVGVIGIGNLGKRHVEAFLRSSLDLNIFCLDVVKKSEEDFKNSDRIGNKELHFCTEYSDLPKEMDLVIIATVSSVRRNAFEQLVERSTVKNIVFEKVLFSCPDDYEVVLGILDDRKIKAWVNCGRRETDQYAQVKKLLEREEFFETHISGGRWGLLCNGIHFLDLISFLAGDLNGFEITNLELFSDIFEGKRKGFYEAYGSISGSVSRCRCFNISCFDSDMPVEVLIDTPNIRMTVCEGRQKLVVEQAENGWEKTISDFKMPYVSVGMTKVDDRILEDGVCDLPTYRDSMMIHMEYLKHLAGYFENSGFIPGNIPIT